MKEGQGKIGGKRGPSQGATISENAKKKTKRNDLWTYLAWWFKATRFAHGLQRTSKQEGV